MKFFAFAMLAMTAQAEVTMTTKSWGSEIRYEIYDNSGSKICEGGPFPNYKNDIHTSCEVQGSGMQLKCIDTYGDGWHGGFITIGGEKFCEDFRRGHLKVVDIP